MGDNDDPTFELSHLTRGKPTPPSPTTTPVMRTLTLEDSLLRVHPAEQDSEVSSRPQPRPQLKTRPLQPHRLPRRSREETTSRRTPRSDVDHPRTLRAAMEAVEVDAVKLTGRRCQSQRTTTTSQPDSSGQWETHPSQTVPSASSEYRQQSNRRMMASGRASNARSLTDRPSSCPCPYLSDLLQLHLPDPGHLVVYACSSLCVRRVRGHRRWRQRRRDQARRRGQLLLGDLPPKVSRSHRSLGHKL